VYQDYPTIFEYNAIYPQAVCGLVESNARIKMSRLLPAAACFVSLFALGLARPAWSQEAEPDLGSRAAETLESAKETADVAARTIDQNVTAQEISGGILSPIYRLAEAISNPAFHWIGFAIMVAGVVSFALQLTLGKLVALTRAGFSPSEILSDALGLAVSLVGLVLATQAAAENSNFTGSAAAV
jgi:hypothetical protein